MTPTPQPIAYQIHELSAYALLRLRGELSSAGVASLRQPLTALLLDRGHVVVDVSELTVSSPSALEVFSAALAEVGGWPLARLVLLGADPALADAAAEIKLDRAVALADTAEAAGELLHQRPAWLRRDVDLPATGVAAKLARSAVNETCREWGQDRLTLPATAIATELVLNAVQHANTPSNLAFALTGSTFQLAVRDWGPLSAAELRRFDHIGGQGLVLVGGLADQWGITRHDDGKTIWAAFELP